MSSHFTISSTQIPIGSSPKFLPVGKGSKQNMHNNFPMVVTIVVRHISRDRQRMLLYRHETG